MPANVTLITLTVADIAKATRFYETLGFAKSRESQEAVSFFRAGAEGLVYTATVVGLLTAGAGIWHP